MWSSKWNFAPKKLKVHDNKKIVVLGLKIDGKIWPIQKCSEAEKLTSKKKKLVERKRKLISASTGCNRAYPYMASQEVLLLENGNVRISTSCKQWLATCSLLVLYKKSSTRSSTTWATCRDKKMQFKPQHQMLTLETRYQWLLNWTGPSEYHAHGSETRYTEQIGAWDPKYPKKYEKAMFWLIFHIFGVFD